MTDQEKEQSKNTLRIINNTVQLLQNEGTFQGKHAVPLLEALGLLRTIAAGVENSLKQSSLVLPDKELTIVPAGTPAQSA